MRSVVKNVSVANCLLSGSAEKDFMPTDIDIEVALPSLMICRFKFPLFTAMQNSS